MPKTPEAYSWLTSEPPPKSLTFGLLLVSFYKKTQKGKVLRASQKKPKYSPPPPPAPPLSCCWLAGNE